MAQLRQVVRARAFFRSAIVMRLCFCFFQRLFATFLSSSLPSQNRRAGRAKVKKLRQTAREVRLAGGLLHERSLGAAKRLEWSRPRGSINLPFGSCQLRCISACSLTVEPRFIHFILDGQAAQAAEKRKSSTKSSTKSKEQKWHQQLAENAHSLSSSNHPIALRSLPRID